MISCTTKKFRISFDKLPQTIQKQAKEAYQQFQKNPYHPSLHFKRIHSVKPIFSVRINVDYRSIGIQEENIIVVDPEKPHK